jgi:hypothetical protein
MSGHPGKQASQIVYKLRRVPKTNRVSDGTGMAVNRDEIYITRRAYRSSGRIDVD